MDGMQELFGNAFSRLPYFSPFSMVNKSGTCATSRILQTRWLGVNSVRVEDKIVKEAHPASGSETFDSTEHHVWMCRHACVAAVMEAAAAQQSKEEWACILLAGL